MAIIDIATITNVDPTLFALWVISLQTQAAKACRITFLHNNGWKIIKNGDVCIFGEWLMNHAKSNAPIPCMLLQEYIKEL